MKVKELIEKLNQYNPEAEFSVFSNGERKSFSIYWTGNEGQEKNGCYGVEINCDDNKYNEEKAK